MNKIFLGILLTALSFTSNSYACETLMIGSRELPFLVRERDKPTVEYVGEIPGLHDGNLSILEVMGGIFGSWSSKYAVSIRVPQGDARQAVSLLGPLVSHFIGIRAVKGEEFKMTIPDFDEVIGALKKLNKALIKLGYEPVPISFYLQTKELEQAYMYVKLFSGSMQLPFSMKPRLRIHDVAYHLGLIALPVEVLMPIVERYRLALEFYNYASLQNPDQKSIETLTTIMKNMERNIDVGLGNTQGSYAVLAQENAWMPRDRRKTNEDRYNKFYKSLGLEWSRFVFVDGSSRDFIESHILRAMTEEEASHTLIADTFLGKRLEEFIKQTQNVDWSIRAKLLTPMELHEKIVKRRMELMRAVYLIQRGGI